MKNQKNSLSYFADLPLIERCNDACKGLKTYFLLPFIALDSARTHFYTAVNLVDEQSLFSEKPSKTMDETLANFIFFTGYESLLYIKLVNQPVERKISTGDKCVYLEINIFSFFETKVFMDLYKCISNRNILKNRKDGNTCLIIEFEDIYPQIIRQFFASHFGVTLSGGSNSGKELLTVQHFALTRLLDLKYPGYVPTILENNVSIGNKLRSRFGKELQLNDVIEYDSFKEYIISKYYPK